MTFNQAVTICLRLKYASFSDRAPRSEYWWFGFAVLLYSIMVIVVFFAVNAASGGFSKVSGLSSFGLLTLMFGGIGYVALILPSIAVTVRRFHDVNLSGWWVLASFLLGAMPLVGWLASVAVLVVTLLKGSAGQNRFGPDPLIQS